MWWSILILIINLLFWFGSSKSHADAEVADWRISESTFASLETNPHALLGQSLRGAVRDGRSPEVRRLLSEGADPNARGSWDESPLMYAAKWNRWHITEELLKAGADPNLRDHRDWSAVHYAAEYCAYRPLHAILSSQNANTEINARDLQGRTPLHHAAKSGCVQVVKALLTQPRLALNALDDDGKTALTLVHEESITEVGGPYSEISRLLRGAGGKDPFEVRVDVRPPPAVNSPP